MAMTSSRPYIMRALYEWIVDNGCTPYVLANALAQGVLVPQQYVKEGQIVLNISPGAVVDLDMSNEAMTFNGRFGGVPTDVHVPMTAVIGIYARENGQGMVFEPDEEPTQPTTPDDDPPPSGKGKKAPSLKVVK